MLLDADFLLISAIVGLTMVAADAMVLAGAFSRSLPVLWIRVGISLTRSDPGTLGGP